MARKHTTFECTDTYESEDKTFCKHMYQLGTEGTKPNDGATCSLIMWNADELNIDESLMGGYKFDNKNAYDVTIGEGDTVFSELFDRVLCTMNEGETSYIKTKVDCKGKQTTESDLRNTPIKFSIQLQSVSRAAELEDLMDDETLDRAQHHKDKGTELYKEKRHDYARKRFTKALKFCQTVKQANLPLALREQCSNLTVQLHLNLALCYSGTKEWKEVIEHCNSVLELDANNEKALYRKGQAYVTLLQYNDGLACMKLGMQHHPNNSLFRKEVTNIQKLIKDNKTVYKNMFK